MNSDSLSITSKTPRKNYSSISAKFTLQILHYLGFPIIGLSNYLTFCCTAVPRHRVNCSRFDILFIPMHHRVNSMFAMLIVAEKVSKNIKFKTCQVTLLLFSLQRTHFSHKPILAWSVQKRAMCTNRFLHASRRKMIAKRKSKIVVELPFERFFYSRIEFSIFLLLYGAANFDKS